MAGCVHTNYKSSLAWNDVLKEDSLRTVCSAPARSGSCCQFGGRNFFNEESDKTLVDEATL